MGRNPLLLKLLLPVYEHPTGGTLPAPHVTDHMAVGTFRRNILAGLEVCEAHVRLVAARADAASRRPGAASTVVAILRAPLAA